MKEDLTRRGFIRTGAAGGCRSLVAERRRGPTVFAADSDKPALLGGTRCTGRMAAVAAVAGSLEPKMLEVYRSCKWFRGSGTHVTDFETAYAQLLGARKCLATASVPRTYSQSPRDGVDAGDEVITSPYTFIATYNSILTTRRYPSSPTPTRDAHDGSRLHRKPDHDRTRAILPVHIFGMPCEWTRSTRSQRNTSWRSRGRLPGVACGNKGHKCGTIGDVGCFSFQESKHIRPVKAARSRA